VKHVVKHMGGHWQAVLIPIGLALVARGIAHLNAVTEARVAEILDLDTRIAQRREQLGLVELLTEATAAKTGTPEPPSEPPSAPAQAPAETGP
jgi:hypothetical protein